MLYKIWCCLYGTCLVLKNSFTWTRNFNVCRLFYKNAEIIFNSLCKWCWTYNQLSYNDTVLQFPLPVLCVLLVTVKRIDAVSTGGFISFIDKDIGNCSRIQLCHENHPVASNQKALPALLGPSTATLCIHYGGHWSRLISRDGRPPSFAHVRTCSETSTQKDTNYGVVTRVEWWRLVAANEKYGLDSMVSP